MFSHTAHCTTHCTLHCMLHTALQCAASSLTGQSFTPTPDGRLPAAPSGGLWRPLAASGALWRPLASSGALWQPLAASPAPGGFRKKIFDGALACKGSTLHTVHYAQCTVWFPLDMFEDQLPLAPRGGCMSRYVTVKCSVTV
jgi:hypothetical protein